jgi:hypothetical protein
MTLHNSMIGVERMILSQEDVFVSCRCIDDAESHCPMANSHKGGTFRRH